MPSFKSAVFVGLAGKNLYEQALADQYVEGWQDIITPYFKVGIHILQGNPEAAVIFFCIDVDNSLVML